MDGEEIGDITVNVDEPYIIPGVDSGNHTLKLLVQGTKPFIRDVQVERGKDKVVRLLLAKAGNCPAAS